MFILVCVVQACGIDTASKELLTTLRNVAFTTVLPDHRKPFAQRRPIKQRQ
jgi:hypothetical protein